MGAAIRIPGPRVRATGSALLLCLAASCATIEAPTGGPADTTPPTVLSTKPDSGAVGLHDFARFEVLFSEKVQPDPAERILHFYPPLAVRKTRWRGRRRLIVELRDTLPADTVLVIEIPRGYRDIHRVSSVLTSVIPLASADSLPRGELSGSIQVGDEPAAAGVVELFEVAPDSLDFQRLKPLRRSAASQDGAFRLSWLPIPGGPWRLRVFEDTNGDMRPGENEPQRLMPTVYRLDEATPQLAAGQLTVYKPTTPGRLVMLDRPVSNRSSPLFGWSETIAETDTGFAPARRRQRPEGWAAISATDTTDFPDAGPGLTRLIIFADVDGDSLLSAVPDSSFADSLRWYWEPYTILDSLLVEPGLPLTVPAPTLPDTLSICRVPPPAPAAADSVAAVSPASSATDSTASENPATPGHPAPIKRERP